MTINQFLILAAFTIPIFGYAQQSTYQGEWVDSLIINSNSSYYHFDTCGTTTGTYDEYLIVFNKEKNQYILNQYKRTKYKVLLKPDTSFLKGKMLKQGRVIDRRLISNLLRQFEPTYVKPAFNNIGLTNEMFLKLTGKKYILQVAKWYKADWYFEKGYATKEQNERIFKGCQNIDTLNLYLANAFDTSGYVIVTDVSDVFEVQIVTEKTHYRFEGKYPNPFKQPWYHHIDDNGSVITKSILNLSINQAMVDLLPNNFSSIRTLQFEALTNDYICWYLKRQGILFDY